MLKTFLRLLRLTTKYFDLIVKAYMRQPMHLKPFWIAALVLLIIF